MMHLHTTKLHPAFLNAAERFIEKYLDEDIRIVKSDNEEEKFDHGTYNYNLLLDDLTSLEICKNINEEYFLTFSNPKHINCKQFIVLQFIKINLPLWSRRFKRGLNYIKELESIDSIVFQCLGELGIFKEKLSDESINFIHEVKKILYGEKDDGNNLDLGKLGEKLSYEYEYMQTGIMPSYESLKNETSGYDIESFYKDGS